MILRIARLVPVRGNESTVTDHLRLVMDGAPNVPGLIMGSVARQLEGERQVVWVVTCWESIEALTAFVGGDLASVALPPAIRDLVEESTVSLAEGVGSVWGSKDRAGSKGETGSTDQAGSTD